MRNPVIDASNKIRRSKPSKNRNLLETLSKDDNLKYIYKLNKNYYYIRRFKKKLYKICLHTTNLIKTIEYKIMIDKKFDLKPNLIVNFNPQSNEVNIKKEENDTDEDVINFLQKFNQNHSQTPQNEQLTKLSIDDIIEQFVDNQRRIKKRKESYITELNSSLKYLKFFIAEYKITKIENLNSEISIYPNPVQNKEVFFKGNIQGVEIVKMYDMNGKLVYEAVKPFAKTNKLTLKNLPKGNYIITYDNQSQKLIIE